MGSTLRRASWRPAAGLLHKRGGAHATGKATTGTAVEQQVNRAAAASAHQLSVDPLGDQIRSPPPPAAITSERQEERMMTYRAKERGEWSEDYVAAGDWLGAFGATLVLPVQKYKRCAKAIAIPEFLRGLHAKQAAVRPGVIRGLRS